MANTSVEEFSILSPSQKKELERKHQEKIALETAEAIRKAEAAKLAKEKAKLKAEALAAERQRAKEKRESKKSKLKFWIGVLYVLIAFVIWLWIHYCHKLCVVIWQDNIVAEIFLGMIIYALALIVVGPIIAGIAKGIEKLKDKLKTM